MTTLDNDLISRKDLLAELNKEWYTEIVPYTKQGVIELITNAPTIEANSGEAVAWIHPMYLNSAVFTLEAEVAFFKPNEKCIPLYTSPQKREWVDLTQEEFDEIFENTPYEKMKDALSNKLKEVNHG